MKIIYPNSTGGEITAKPRQMANVVQIIKRKVKIKEHEEKIEKKKMSVAEYMGENEVLVANDGQKLATFRTSKSGSRIFRTY